MQKKKKIGGSQFGRSPYEGAVDIREIKEVRQGYRESRDFSKWSEDVQPEAKSRCFVVFYGSEFNLKTLSCLTLYADDCATWCQGIRYLAEDVRRESNRLHQVRVWVGLGLPNSVVNWHIF